VTTIDGFVTADVMKILVQTNAPVNVIVRAVLPGLKVLPVQEVRKVPQVQEAHKVQEVLPEYRVLRVLQVKPVLPDCRVPWVRPVP